MTYIVVAGYVLAVLFICAFFRWKAKRDRDADRAAKRWLYTSLLSEPDGQILTSWKAATGEDYKSPSMLRLHIINLLERLDD